MNQPHTNMLAPILDPELLYDDSPGPEIQIVRYGDLVENPEITRQRIFGFPDEHRGSAATPHDLDPLRQRKLSGALSQDQVSQPVRTSFHHRWQRYATRSAP